MLMMNHCLVYMATLTADYLMLLPLTIGCWYHWYCWLLQKSMSDTSRANIMPFTTIFTWLLFHYNYACYIILVIDQPFADFLTNYLSAHMDEDFEVRVLKLIPSALICEERYQKISFHKVIQNWLFKYRGTNKGFSLFYLLFSFLLVSPLSFFFFFFSFFLFLLSFFSFSFAFLGEYDELIFRKKLRLKVPHEN